MMRYLPAFADRAVPRYTSYPTAAEFHAGIGPADQACALRALPHGAPVSLYVHIPYCRQLCFYCACNTGAAGLPERQTRYLDALSREIRTVAAEMRGRVVSIHFGGGSPNALDPADFEALVGGLKASFDCADRPEIAVELDPRLLDRGYAEALSRAGVTRVSLGVQTFAPHVQAAIGRIQPYAQIFEAVRDLRQAGIDRIAFDLMYGLPLQTVNDVAETVVEAINLRPDRIALFGYAHVPGLQPRQRAIDTAALPDGPTRFAQSALAHDMLVEDGYRAIGFDHFARPDDTLGEAAGNGRLRRNFQGFTDEPGTAIIGLGASAISQFEGLIVQNLKHEAAYREAVNAGALGGCRGVARGAEDRMRGNAIERLLCDETVDLAEVAARHGKLPDIFASALPRLAEMEAAALIARDGWRFTLTDSGRPYARVAASSLDAWRDGSAGTFSRAV